MFKVFAVFLHLVRFRCYAHGFFSSFCVFAGMLMGVLMCLYTFSVLAAMLMGVLIFVCFCWYAHGFFDVFAPLVRFVAMFIGLLILFCFLLVYSLFFLTFLHTLSVLAAMLPSESNNRTESCDQVIYSNLLIKTFRQVI